MLRSHLKLAWKVLLRRKFFTAISLVGISLTLVVLSVATAMIDGVVAPRPPETRLDRTLGIYVVGMIGPQFRRTGFAGYGFLDRYARDLPGVEEESFASVAKPVVSYVEGQRVRSFLKLADASFWRVLDFDFVEGGPFGDAEVEAGSRVAVINRTTRLRFFGSGEAVGRPIEIDGRRFRVVGVVDDVPVVRLASFADVWVPLTTARSDGYRSEMVGDFSGLLLASDRSRFPQIKAEVASRFRDAQVPDPRQFETMVGGADTVVEGVARFLGSDPAESRPRVLLVILGGAALAFMLLPAINLVNLNLSRILERASEIGVRKAFGASSRALVGQFLVENVLLTLIGGAIGLAVSALVLGAINRSGVIAYADFTVNLRVFAWGMALAVIFGLVSGVYPAWRMSRLQPAAALAGRS
jgi:putative ABC transport system permease protein